MARERRAAIRARAKARQEAHVVVVVPLAELPPLPEGTQKAELRVAFHSPGIELVVLQHDDPRRHARAVKYEALGLSYLDRCGIREVETGAIVGHVYHFGGADERERLESIYARHKPKHRDMLRQVVQWIHDHNYVGKGAKTVLDDYPEMYSWLCWRVNTKECNHYVAMSWRCWGSLMQAVVAADKRAKGKRAYNGSYLDYYP